MALKGVVFQPNDLDLAKAATSAAVQKAIAAYARQQHSIVMRTDPRPTTFRRSVDGIDGANEDSVRPFGRIVYLYPRLPIVVQYAMEVLYDRSPVDSGEYRDAHTIFLNGAPVSDLSSYEPSDEIVISNLVPYARKIELGKMRMRVGGTDHVYEQAQQLVQRRYGGVAKIRFTFTAIFGGDTALEQWASKTRTSSGRHRHGQRSYADWTRRQPALVISEK